MTINQYTTIKDLRRKLSHIIKYKAAQIAIGSVKSNDIKAVHVSA